MNAMTLKVEDELYERIVEYWHEHRLSSRSEAIRELLAYALDRKLSDKPAKGSETR